MDPLPLVHQGYDPIAPSDIPFAASGSAFQVAPPTAAPPQAPTEAPTPASAAPPQRQLKDALVILVSSSDLFRSGLLEICRRQYSICIDDTMATREMANIDVAKLDFLRQCCRKMDATIELEPQASAATKEKTVEARAELTFGDTANCPNDCNGKGDCVASGCACHKGFTGLSCDVSYL